MKLLPTRSTLLHLRLPFSLFLLPVFLFALSQAPQIIGVNAVLTFIIWHLLVYPASNGYNSYFDADEDSIALIEYPPKVDESLFNFSLLLDFLALILSVFVSLELTLAVWLYGLFSKLYSHPKIRLKKLPIVSFLVVFIFQGACIYWSTYAAISGLSIFTGWNTLFTIAGLTCSCLIGASYPLTQVYQHKEDNRRGDLTLSILLGIKGTFIFAGALFLAGTSLMLLYWIGRNELPHFYLFLLIILPVIFAYFRWLVQVWRDEKEANYRQMIRMTWLSSIAMFVYFSILCAERIWELQ